MDNAADVRAAVLCPPAHRERGACAPDNGLEQARQTGGDRHLPSSTLLSLTTDGQATQFPYLNSIALDPSYPTYGAETTVASNPGGTVDTLVSGPGNTTMLGVYTTPDGRQTMFQTFNHGSRAISRASSLRHGELGLAGAEHLLRRSAQLPRDRYRRQLPV